MRRLRTTDGTNFFRDFGKKLRQRAGVFLRNHGNFWIPLHRTTSSNPAALLLMSNCLPESYCMLLIHAAGYAAGCKAYYKAGSAAVRLLCEGFAPQTAPIFSGISGKNSGSVPAFFCEITEIFGYLCTGQRARIQQHCFSCRTAFRNHIACY